MPPVLATGELWALGKRLIIPREELLQACAGELDVIDRTFEARCQVFLGIVGQSRSAKL